MISCEHVVILALPNTDLSTSWMVVRSSSSLTLFTLLPDRSIFSFSNSFSGVFNSGSRSAVLSLMFSITTDLPSDTAGVVGRRRIVEAQLAGPLDEEFAAGLFAARAEPTNSPLIVCTAEK